jgi:hypothetical protein
MQSLAQVDSFDSSTDLYDDGLKKGRQSGRLVRVGTNAGMSGSLEENEKGETDDRECNCRYQRIQEEAIVRLEVQKHAAP